MGLSQMQGVDTSKCKAPSEEGQARVRESSGGSAVPCIERGNRTVFMVLGDNCLEFFSCLDNFFVSLGELFLPAVASTLGLSARCLLKGHAMGRITN